MRKYIKLLAFLCLPLAFTACDDDENLNGGEATVQFQAASLTVSEVATSLDLPIVVTGEHDGLIKVLVEYKEAHGLKDDENVIITSRDLLIPAGTEHVEVETRLSVANDEMETGRILAFEIVDVQGATLGTNAICEVSLKEASPIEGSYALTGMDLRTSSVGSTLCTLTLSEAAANTLELNFGMGAIVSCPFAEGEKEGDYVIQIPGLSEIGQGLSLALFDAASMSLYPNDFTGHFDGETKVITLEPATTPDLGICFVDMSTMSLYYAWTAYTDQTTGETVPLQMIKQ